MVRKRFNSENTVSPDHIRDAAHLELVKKFSGFYQPILFGLIREKLASTEQVTLEFQLIFDELDGFEVHIQKRTNLVYADAIAVGDPLLDGATNPVSTNSSRLSTFWRLRCVHKP